MILIQPRELLGGFIEVWGAQIKGGREASGNSSYAVDGSQYPNNTNILQPVSHVLPSILFSASGLGTEGHTLMFTNGGVNLYIAHFKVQNTELAISTIAPASGGQSRSGQSTPGVTYTAMTQSELTGAHYYL